MVLMVQLVQQAHLDHRELWEYKVHRETLEQQELLEHKVQLDLSL
jgi:hypothetical protein